MTLIDKAEAHDDDLIRRWDIGPRLAEAGFGGDLLQAAIAAIPPAKQEHVADSNARGVGVKPLVWEDTAWAQSENSTESALSQFGRYYVQHGAMYWGPGVIVSTGYPTLDAAKAAAQADYEARIFAALEPSPLTPTPVGDSQGADTAVNAADAPAWLSNCVVCGRIVDTREKPEGGDGHGCEYPEGWTCSSECAEKLHPDPEWMQEGLAADARGAALLQRAAQLAYEVWDDPEALAKAILALGETRA